MQRFLRKTASNTNASSHFSVGADAYIGPMGSCEFAENLRENGAFCRADVGIGPYKKIVGVLANTDDFVFSLHYR